MTVRALFLDRDGIINIDHGYTYRRENFEFMPGIFEVARAAVAANYRLFVVTNQAGIGRGYYSEADFLELTDWMCERFKEEGAPIAQVYYCPSHPTAGIGQYRTDSPDRKPNPGMIIRAAKEHNINLLQSILIGDKESDIAAGISAGVGQNILLAESASEKTYAVNSVIVISKISESIKYLK
jgi:D-glycero-D-manno-heptose 1,7-bisphosphate phosphatase